MEGNSGWTDGDKQSAPVMRGVHGERSKQHSSCMMNTQRVLESLERTENAANSLVEYLPRLDNLVRAMMEHQTSIMRIMNDSAKIKLDAALKATEVTESAKTARWRINAVMVVKLLSALSAGGAITIFLQRIFGQ